MLTKSIMKIVLGGVLVAASISPTLAARRAMHTPRPCAAKELRCFTDCDKNHWCHVYACSFNQTVLLPFACNSQNGACMAPHC
jgi:hypothetical protein